MNTGELVRVLLLAGFEIQQSTRFPQHIEVRCWTLDALGARVDYLFAVSDTGEWSDATLATVRELARREARVVAVIGPEPGDAIFGWKDFLLAFGGSVPSWRALTDDYPDRLALLASNKTPSDETREAWRLFEDAVADGFEFVLGRHVTRLGAARRGRRVSDILAATPDGSICVVDAKASANPYSVDAPHLRPLGEYVRSQVTRQQGQNPVEAGIVVAAAFEQDKEHLAETANGFLADYGVPLVLLEAATLTEMVLRLKVDPQLRNAIRWKQIFRRNGLVDRARFLRECSDAQTERVPR